MRCGFVLIVCVPSGVSFESMMYVGMALPSSRSLEPAAGPGFYPTGRRRCTPIGRRRADRGRIDRPARLFRER
jgi:hypothetical protein